MDIELSPAPLPGDVLTFYLHYNSTSKLFTFSAGPAATYPAGAETLTLQGPTVNVGDPSIEMKGVMYTNYNGGDATDLVSTAMFDNIKVDGVDYEDFDTPLYSGKPNVFFDATKWYQNSKTPSSTPSFLRNDWVSRGIENGQIVLTAQNQGLEDVRINQSATDAYSTNFLQGNVTLDPTSFYSGSAGHARVQLYLHVYNDTYDGTTNPYNGEEGAVYPTILLFLDGDGKTLARANLGRGVDNSGTNYEALFQHDFACTPELGSPNTISIELIDKTFYFTCDDETVSHTVTTPMYDGEYGKLNRFRTRVRSSGAEYGYLKAHIDNVKFHNTNIMGLFPAILTATKQNQ